MAQFSILANEFSFKPSSIIFTDRETIFYLCETKIGQIEKCAWHGYLKVVPPFHAPSFLTTLHLRVRLAVHFFSWTSSSEHFGSQYYHWWCATIIIFMWKKNCYWSRIYSPWRTKMKQNFCVGGHKIELPPMIKSVSAKFATKNKTTQLLLLLFH